MVRHFMVGQVEGLASKTEFIFMQLDNPAVYECRGSSQGIHLWRRNDDGAAYCLNCRQKLTKKQADEVWTNND